MGADPGRRLTARSMVRNGRESARVALPGGRRSVGLRPTVDAGTGGATSGMRSGVGLLGRGTRDSDWVGERR